MLQKIFGILFEAITDSNGRIARDHKIANFIASLWQPYWNFPAFEMRPVIS